MVLTKLKYVTAGAILTIAAIVLFTTVKLPQVLKPSMHSVVTRQEYKRVVRQDGRTGFSSRTHGLEAGSIVKTDEKAEAGHGSESNEIEKLLEEVAWSEVDDDSAELEIGEDDESNTLDRDDDSTELHDGEGGAFNSVNDNSAKLEKGDGVGINRSSEVNRDSAEFEHGEGGANDTVNEVDNDSGEFESGLGGVNDTFSEQYDVEAPLGGGGNSIDDDDDDDDDNDADADDHDDSSNENRPSEAIEKNDRDAALMEVNGSRTPQKDRAGKLHSNPQLERTNAKRKPKGLEEIKKEENIVLSSAALLERIKAIRPLVWRRINESLGRTRLLPSKQVDEVARNISAGFLFPEQRLSDWRTPCWKKSGALHCLPSSYVLGFQGCATNDLYFRLTAHPEVIPSWRAESQFWTRDFSSSLTKSMSNYGATVKLKSMFKSKNNILLEKNTRDTWRSVTDDANLSPRYWNMLHAQMIKKLTPDAKFIVTLCNPISRRSFTGDFIRIRGCTGNLIHGRDSSGKRMKIIRHFYAREDKAQHKRSTTQEFHKKIKEVVGKVTNCLEDKELEECFNHQWASQVSLDFNYLLYLKDWLAVFPRDRFFFIKTEQWGRVKNRMTILQDLYKFLDISAPSQRQLILQAAMHKVDDMSYRHHEPNLRHPLPKTIEVLEAFYEPFNKELANFLKDSRFTWQSW